MEGQIERVAELAVALYAVWADTQYNRVMLLKLRISVAETARLDFSAACEVFGVEVQRDILTPVVRELYRFAVFVQ